LQRVCQLCKEWKMFPNNENTASVLQKEQFFSSTFNSTSA